MAQEPARVSAEVAGGIVAGALADLPKAAAAYYAAEGDRWDLTVLHDYGSVEEGATQVVRRLNVARKSIPFLDIRTSVVRASMVPDGYLKGEKMIYERWRLAYRRHAAIRAIL